MEQYIRKNEDGESVLDYGLLDTAARANFYRDLENWASMMEPAIDFEDSDFSEAEKILGIESTVDVELDNLHLINDDQDDVEIDQDTRIIMAEELSRYLIARYGLVGS